MTAALVFVASAAVVVAVGPRMARVADSLATATRLGGALFGVVFLALATDLPEVALTPAAVLSGTPKIAIGGLLGSTAAQLALIGVLDIALRRHGFRRRVSMLPGVGQCGLLLLVLATPLALAAGDLTVAGMAVGWAVLAAIYVAALASLGRIRTGGGQVVPIAGEADVAPAGEVGEGGEEGEEGEAAHGLAGLWLRFAGYGVLLVAAGLGLEASAGEIGEAIGISETAAGALLAGLVTSLPEAVTAAAAIRVGAHDLAFGDLVGSSALDVALLSLADLVHTDGSIFELIGRPEAALIGVSVTITALVLLGFARRRPGGARGAGAESYLIVGAYVAGAVALLTSG